GRRGTRRGESSSRRSACGRSRPGSAAPPAYSSLRAEERALGQAGRRKPRGRRLMPRHPPFEPSLAKTQKGGEEEIAERGVKKELEGSERRRIDVLKRAKELSHTNDAEQRCALDHEREL